MRINLLAFLLPPLVALGGVRVDSGVVQQPITIGSGVSIYTPEVQPETSSWQRAVIANGGSYSAVDVRAVDYFVRECKAKGIWPLLDWVSLFAGRNLNAALVPLKRTVGNAIITNNNFVESDFSPMLGLTGDGSTKRLLPGLFRGDCRAANDVSLGVFISANALGSVGNVSGLMGTELNPAGNRLHVFLQPNNGSIGGRVNNTTAFITTTGSAPRGLTGLSRISSQDTSYIWSEGHAGSIDHATSGIPPNQEILIFSRGSGEYFSRSIGGAWFGGGFTSDQRSDFAAIWKQTMTLLSRPTNSETYSWMTAVVANGGTYNEQDVRAVDYFVTECKAKGIWGSLDWVNLFAGRNLNAALVALKFVVGNQVVTNNNFVEADYSPVLGLTGNGTNKDLTPGLDRDQCRAADNVHLATFITGVGAISSARGLIGTTISGNLELFAGSSNFVLGRINNGITITSAAAPSLGLVIGNKIATEETVVSMNDSETAVAQGTGVGSAAIRVFSAGGTNYNSGSQGMASFGAGLTLQQRIDYRAIVQKTMTLLGRPTL